MIRTQMYLEDQTHRDLIRLAEQENRSMAEVMRDILKEGLQKRKTIDRSGKKALLKLLEISVEAGGDDPYVSDNHDHYLYGSPKKRI
jgi:hypothetical protein